jgi:hypothetical protein
MMQIEPEGVGKRVRLSIAGEHYYLIGTRAADGGIDYTVTCPDENKATGVQRRITAEKICAECSVLSRMV